MQILGLLLLVLGAGVFILVYGMRIKARQTERLANLYQQAMEHGHDPRALQFQLEAQEQGDPQGNLKAGILLLALALAIILGMIAADHLPGPYRVSGFAIVPALLGLACLCIHFFVPRPLTK